jgi:hypothetical protein
LFAFSFDSYRCFDLTFREEHRIVKGFVLGILPLIWDRKALSVSS